MDPLQAARAVAEAAAFEQLQHPSENWLAVKGDEDKFVLDSALQLALEGLTSPKKRTRDVEAKEDDTRFKRPKHEVSMEDLDGKSLESIVFPDLLADNLEKYPTAVCNRCKKEFAQMAAKQYRMCKHCRELQRLRSRRWQLRTKNKGGVCRRCATKIEPDPQNNFVLCLQCREKLRSRKVHRAENGKCIHCSGPNEEGSNYKVCRRCRNKDRLRRVELERMGACNRCSQTLDEDDKGYKLCRACRAKKKLKDEEDRYLSPAKAAVAAVAAAADVSKKTTGTPRSKVLFSPKRYDPDASADMAMMFDPDLILPELRSSKKKPEEDESDGDEDDGSVQLQHTQLNRQLSRHLQGQLDSADPW